MSSKDGRDTPTPAMPVNLVTNPYAPVTKRRTKPSAKQRAKNRAAKAAIQQALTSPVLPPVELMDQEPSVEFIVAEVLVDLAESIASSSLEDQPSN